MWCGLQAVPEETNRNAKADVMKPINATAPRRYQSTFPELLAEAGVLLFIALMVAFFGSNTKAMSLIVAVVIAGRFAVLRRRGDVVIFLAGLLLGGGNDLLSMWRGVYWYTPPTILPVPIPVWMLFFWGEAFLFFRRLMRFGPFLGPEAGSARLLDRAFLLDLAILIPLRAVLYQTAAIPWVPDVFFATVLLVRYLILPPARHERRLLLTILVLGPFYEILLIAAGLYVYQHGVLFGMPLWLAIYWIYIFRVLKALADWMEGRFAACD